MAPPVPRLMGKALTAAYLGISERMFDRIADVPNPIRLGRRMLWDRKVIDLWIDDLSGLGVKPNFFGD